MTVTLNKAILKTIATGFNKIIARRITVPVLGHLLFARGSDGCLHVTGTNLDETLTLKLSDALPEDGATGTGFLVPFDTVKNLAGSLSKDAAVRFEAMTDAEVGYSVTVDGQTTTSRIGSVSVEEFPVDGRNVTQRATGPLDGFLGAFRRVVTFASTDETRHVLNGVFWDGDDAVLVATDGRRIGCVAPPEFNIPQSLIIPRAKFLEKQPVQGGESVDFLVLARDNDQSDFAIVGNTFEYRVRCIDGTYPNYRQVIPDARSAFAGKIAVHPDDIPMVKEAANRLAGDGPDHAIALYGGVHGVALVSPAALSQEPGPGDIHIRLVHSTFERHMAETSACCVNVRLLLDFLENGFTSLHVSDGFNAWLVEGAGTGAIMPLRMDAADPILAYAEKHLAATATTPSQEPQTVPVTATEKESPTMEITQPAARPKPEPARQTTPHKPELTMVEVPDPMETFLGLLTDAQDKLSDATTAVRDLRKAAKTLERIHKDRDKQLVTRERDIQKSLKLFNQLQESLAA